MALDTSCDASLPRSIKCTITKNVSALLAVAEHLCWNAFNISGTRVIRYCDAGRQPYSDLVVRLGKSTCVCGASRPLQRVQPPKEQEASVAPMQDGSLPPRGWAGLLTWPSSSVRGTWQQRPTRGRWARRRSLLHSDGHLRAHAFRTTSARSLPTSRTQTST